MLGIDFQTASPNVIAKLVEALRSLFESARSFSFHIIIRNPNSTSYRIAAINREALEREQAMRAAFNAAPPTLFSQLNQLFHKAVTKAKELLTSYGGPVSIALAIAAFSFKSSGIALNSKLILELFSKLKSTESVKAILSESA